MTKAVKNNNKLCDCYGLVKGFLFSDETGKMAYKSKYDVNTAGAYHKAKEKGLLSTLPEIPGIILYMSGHVGVYIGNGEFIECMGGGVGMFKGKIENGKIIKGSKFTNWFKDISIEYIENTQEIVEITPLNLNTEEQISEDKKDKVILIINNEEKSIKGFLIDEYNYVNLREVANALGYEIDYDPFEKVPILTKME